jgi:SAM-dependent methyltransferase
MDPTTRFSARAESYAQARPSYPHAVLEVLDLVRLKEPTVIADLGSGTGIFSRLLLESRAVVHAVEPNAEMRLLAERDLGHQPRFHSVAGRSEATTLDSTSIDLVTAAQAFHWFDLEPTRREVVRILRPEGRVALVWNDRDVGTTPFLRDFEAILLEHCPQYSELQGKSDTPEKFDAFFGTGRWARSTVANEQQLDRAGLVLRVMSSSYAPLEGSPGHEALVASLEAVFDRHARDGIVTLGYTTAIIVGRPQRP